MSLSCLHCVPTVPFFAGEKRGPINFAITEHLRKKKTSSCIYTSCLRLQLFVRLSLKLNPRLLLTVRLPYYFLKNFIVLMDQANASSDQDDEILIDAQASTEGVPANPVEESTEGEMRIDEEGRPVFTPAKDVATAYRIESRKVPVPPHRMTPLKANWAKICPPIVEHLKLQVRMNLKSRSVELRTSKFTNDVGALQKGADFVKAFTLGFDLDDAIALLRLDDLYIQTFEVKDVKTLNGEHLGRAIGRIAGKDGKTKFAIENASRTRVVLADQKIHILGGFKNIHIAREAIVSLILGSPPVSLGQCRTLRTSSNHETGQGLRQPSYRCFSHEGTVLIQSFALVRHGVGVQDYQVLHCLLFYDSRDMMTYNVKISIHGNFSHFNYIGDPTIDRIQHLKERESFDCPLNPSSGDGKSPRYPLG